MKKSSLAIVALLMFTMTMGFFAQEAVVADEPEAKKPEADARIAAALDRMEVKYEVDEDGDYRIIIPCDDDRSQLVFVNSNIENYGEFEIREVWSIGYRHENSVPPAIVKKAAKLSGDYIVGAWEMVGDEKLAMVAKVPANLADDTLIGTIVAVGRRADKFEMDTLGTDDL
ncbi:MAG: hypothetical protein J6Y80_03010 [Victivallales bacterium]|nr:hypothetical protein [Victivallales bacterium]